MFRVPRSLIFLRARQCPQAVDGPRDRKSQFNEAPGSAQKIQHFGEEQFGHFFGDVMAGG
ncbi:hypothetical protein CES87_29385 [Pseudomonas sp. ERMR1:02]|nr:hypothetical protein CES87_29385 [Pseudomonas sp. ERMR1:02]